MHGWDPVRGGLRATNDGRGHNIPGPPVDMGAVPGMWHRPGDGIACVLPTDAAWRWHGSSAGDHPPNPELEPQTYQISSPSAVGPRE